MTLTSRDIKQYALESGADIVGIGGMERFAGTPPEHDPRFIAPQAKTIIGMGFRVLRGCLRGIEEQTHFYQFPEMGIVHIDEVHAPTVLRRAACLLEDHGYEGVVQRSVPDRRPTSDMGNNPEHLPVFKIKYAEAVAPDRPAPDVLMDFKQAARVCGLAEVGAGGFPISKRFGPLVRFAFILTESVLETDPESKDELCDRCGACIQACPVQAISGEGALDEWQCTAGRLGADAASNPFLPSEAAMTSKRYNEASVKENIPLWDEAYPRVRFGYTQSICGTACQRACLAHMEARGLLQDQFVHAFR